MQWSTFSFGPWVSVPPLVSFSFAYPPPPAAASVVCTRPPPLAASGLFPSAGPMKLAWKHSNTCILLYFIVFLYFLHPSSLLWKKHSTMVKGMLGTINSKKYYIKCRTHRVPFTEKIRHCVLMYLIWEYTVKWTILTPWKFLIWCGQHGLWSDWLDAQTSRSICWLHMYSWRSSAISTKGDSICDFLNASLQTQFLQQMQSTLIE